MCVMRLCIDAGASSDYVLCSCQLLVNVVFYVSGMMPSDMNSALEKFRSGEIKILVATNVAEMGLDIPDCSLVINYERHIDEVSSVQSEGESDISAVQS